MNDPTLSWIFFIGYCLLITGVVFYNRRKSRTMQSFTIGTRSVSPVFIGLSLAANMTSAATFVINPGLVHAFGFAGFLGYSIATPLGIYIGLVVLSKRFRQVGDRYTVITVPHWIGSRFADRRMTIYLALVSLLQVTFLVLITVGLTMVLSSVLELPILTALAIIILFTFTYIIVGGASAHIWTNTIQAILMILVAFILLGSGAHLFQEGVAGFFEKLNAVGRHYGSVTNPDSALFRDYFETLFCNFIIGLAIITQPHIISKALFLRTERDVNKYLVTAIVVESLFFSMLFVGLYAKLTLTGPDPAPDMVISTYIVQNFSPFLRSVIMLGVLAAGFSTMEGIMLSLSTIFSNDFFANVFGRGRMTAHARSGDSRRPLLVATRIFLVTLAPVTFFLSYDQIVAPSISVAIFAQNGVYGLFSATFIPILFGIFVKRANRSVMFISSVIALVVHFGMYYGGITMYHNNPAVTATCALIASTLFAVTATFVTGRKESTA